MLHAECRLGADWVGVHHVGGAELIHGLDGNLSDSQCDTSEHHKLSRGLGETSVRVEVQSTQRAIHSLQTADADPTPAS